MVDDRAHQPAISFFVKNATGSLERHEVGKNSSAKCIPPVLKTTRTLCVSQSPAFFVKTSSGLEKHEIGETKMTSALSLPIIQRDAAAAVRFFLKSGSGLLIEFSTAYDLGELFKASRQPSFGKYRGTESSNYQNELTNNSADTRCTIRGMLEFLHFCSTCNWCGCV